MHNEDYAMSIEGVLGRQADTLRLGVILLIGLVAYISGLTPEAARAIGFIRKDILLQSRLAPKLVPEGGRFPGGAHAPDAHEDTYEEAESLLDSYLQEVDSTIRELEDTIQHVGIYNTRRATYETLLDLAVSVRGRVVLLRRDIQLASPPDELGDIGILFGPEIGDTQVITSILPFLLSCLRGMSERAIVSITPIIWQHPRPTATGLRILRWW
ncbi:unnamed protein product [Clonostachys chloroleuca]|uniref:Uncharacterized protein n=1 Tax=Clonostachys chloroleuca TaxID=1926264 RepID=A0AA35PUU8_9HYPO|nr:unnamed protein product [Clonostachys chloroleuca]